MAGILANQLPNSQLGNRGEALPTHPSSNPDSRLHFNSSIADSPTINLPTSQISLRGERPSEIYLENLPE